MTEEFLHYIWKFKLFKSNELFTNSGERIEIVKAGEHNTDSGPDFFNANIKIGDTLWAGNVEVHINSSDWIKHQHDSDKAYDNIILHVVGNDDKPIYRKNKTLLPTLELTTQFDEKLYKNYLQFKSSKDWIPCEKQLKNTDSFIINSYLDRLLLERLERKANLISQSLKLNKNNWEETFYQHLAKNFGFKINAEPFELLAKSLPAAYLAKHKNNLLQLEAMLFGQAGMLDKQLADEYFIRLQNEYQFLKQKFKLTPIDNHLWKFLRLRPSNFPTVRISQFANLIGQSSHLFSKIIETTDIKNLKEYLNVEATTFWETHYVFDKTSVKRKKKLGDAAIDTVIINTIVPFLFVYGKQKGEEKYVERSLFFLEKIKGEKNAIVEKWESLGMPVESAYSTQALLQLKNEYCHFKKCLNCVIGNYLIKNQ